MIPSRRLLYLAAAWTLLGLAASFWKPLDQLWLGGGVALLLACAIDAWLARTAPPLQVERRLAGVWPVDVWNAVTLTLHNEGARALDVELMDDYPTAWGMEGLPHATRIESGKFASVTYRLCPDRRGDASFGEAHIRVGSPLGLWQRRYRLGQHDVVKVFPDFSKLLGHALTATDRRAPTAGSIRKRRRGEGTDFRQLREYRQGDSLRAIDWKATARLQKPITREYREERDQQVVFLLDTGRRMLARDGTHAHFDHALNAVLTLGFVAQRQGDAVGLMSFGAETRWMSPAKGRTGLDRLMSGIYDVQAGEAAPDYLQAAGALLKRLGKRAFVVVITNLRDEDDHAMRAACELLASRHLVLCASLRERILDNAIEAPVLQFNDALRHCATALYLEQRSDAIRRLGMRAGQLIDVVPEKLGMVLVNRYLDIKESGQL
ncbi:uncharacterized protein (DUF58 family) [Paucimonas lemoignei]|uniref:Uncharacterized protein (DUF58 family) n=1 Tax=Paucimonas lemoignei TaxID=29443 RepID=A0A4R3HVU8_PAULE|nr:DUF58 domain-containing protein [Paucimonas lemoignei]TCS37387.1 uncharacterized protein (DUF58 family) [Paucimonas lemoignei]